MYSREIDGQVLTFSASGWTYDRTFVLYDCETESLWYHFEKSPNGSGLTCISGHYADAFLPELTSVRTRWSTWVAGHPNTGFMLSNNDKAPGCGAP